MKKAIIPILIVVLAGIAIGVVLSNNKKKNQEKIEIVNKGSGNAPVKVATVRKQAVNIDFKANGNLAPNQELKLLSESSGRILSILAKEGEKVTAGQTLATIDDKYLSLDLQTAKDAYKKLKTDKERYEKSLKTGGITQAQYDEIDFQFRNAENRVEQAQKRFNDAQIKAPISGIINKRYIEIGTYLSPGTALFDIVDVSNLKLNVSVNERQVVHLNTGDKITVKVPAFPEQTFSGTISFIAAKADNSLSFPVEIKMDNSNSSLVRAGMYATAIFTFEHQSSAILIPRSAFVGSVNNNLIYVLEGENTARIRTVTPGSIIGESVEILSGLEEGESVIISGQINLTDGTTVEVQKN